MGWGHAGSILVICSECPMAIKLLYLTQIIFFGLGVEPALGVRTFDVPEVIVCCCPAAHADVVVLTGGTLALDLEAAVRDNLPAAPKDVYETLLVEIAYGELVGQLTTGHHAAVAGRA